MDRFWKQFEASAIASGDKVFLTARLKLTVLYVFIVAIIIFGFSLFLYQNISRNLRDASDDEFADTGSQQHFVQYTLSLVEEEILLADIVILLVSAGVSYALAGYTLRPIQLSLEAQKAFSENASHELRTPLAVMKNDIEVLLRNPHPTLQDTQKTLQNTIEEIDHMTQMSKDLLALSRLERIAQPDAQPVSLSDIIHRVAHNMVPFAQAKNITLTVDVASALQAQGDESALMRVLVNIVNNAIEHTLPGGVIHMRAIQTSGSTNITVSDTGEGISPKDLPHIFERFYKGESAKGTGLGLSIVKEIVAQHNGTIVIDSAKGQGTQVIITLPSEG
jgi:two-component system sensor histidine kinase CiaH